MKKLFFLICIPTSFIYAKIAYWEHVDIIERSPMSILYDADLLKQAEALQQEKMYDAALELYKKILAQSPSSFQAHFNMGKIYELLHENDDALESFTHALHHLPADGSHNTVLGNSLLSLGNTFFHMHETEKALITFKKILTISENLSAVHHNIAFTLAEQTDDIDTALSHYQKALTLKPENVESHFCYALALLASGNLLEGFKEYEYRWQRYVHAPRSFNYPLKKMWDGMTDIYGKRVLINVEQGLGDTLMFIRYAQLLKERGATVIAEVQKPLVHLLSLCPYIDEIVSFGDPLPTFDAQIPMLNLPLVFKTTVQSIPADIPYLRADPQLIVEWRKKLTQDTNFKIGVCWRGDPAHGDSKFMPFNYFARLAEIKGITVYSLQKNDPDAKKTVDNPAIDTHIKQFDETFDTTNGRFSDTAAVIKNMNLIITVDTSIAHLAGALDVPTWVVLPFPAEWRWLKDRRDSPWYPSMRLFRQQKFGDWHSVFSELLEALADIIEA